MGQRLQPAGCHTSLLNIVLPEHSWLVHSDSWAVSLGEKTTIWCINMRKPMTGSSDGVRT